MAVKLLNTRLPELDGETAFAVIGILHRIVDELWLLYGDEIFRDAGFSPQIVSDEPDDYTPDLDPNP